MRALPGFRVVLATQFVDVAPIVLLGLPLGHAMEVLATAVWPAQVVPMLEPAELHRGQYALQPFHPHPLAPAPPQQQEHGALPVHRPPHGAPQQQEHGVRRPRPCLARVVHDSV